jgi:hypothetical protein
MMNVERLIFIAFPVSLLLSGGEKKIRMPQAVTVG